MIDDHVPYSYYYQNAKSLHERWVASLKDLRHVSEPTARQVYIDDLVEIHQAARKLLDLRVLGELHEPLVRHIVERDPHQHAAMARATDVIPLW